MHAIRYRDDPGLCCPWPTATSTSLMAVVSPQLGALQSQANWGVHREVTLFRVKLHSPKLGRVQKPPVTTATSTIEFLTKATLSSLHPPMFPMGSTPQTENPSLDPVPVIWFLCPSADDLLNKFSRHHPSSLIPTVWFHHHTPQKKFPRKLKLNMGVPYDPGIHS